MDAELVRSRSKEVAFDADPVADIEQLEHLVVVLADGVLADVDLDAAAPVGELQEPGLSEAADRENPSRGAGRNLRGIQDIRRLASVIGHQRRDWSAGIEASRVDIDTELLQLGEIGAALDYLIGVVCAHSRESVRRMASRMPLMKRTESSALNDRASSSASLMITLPGVSGSCWNS